MRYDRSMAGLFRRAAHPMLDWDLAGRRVRRARRGVALPAAIERLEGRVVPSTTVVTSLQNSGRGTLRSAIEAADHGKLTSPGSHGDMIRFARSARGTILLTSALPALSNDMIICGPGPAALTVARSGTSQTPAFCIFTVGPGALIKITGLTITGGSAVDGGGIDNSGSLSIVNSTVSSNSGTDGGGIDNPGSLSIVNSTVSSNSGTDGGGIDNSGSLSIVNCTVSSNSASGGGGIDNSGSLSLVSTTVIGNSAPGGGGIDSSGSLRLVNSTVQGNSATDGGGIDNSGSLSLVNTTISGNDIGLALIDDALVGGGIEDSRRENLPEQIDPPPPLPSGFGGGIENSGTMSVTSSTFSAELGLGRRRWLWGRGR